MTSSMALDVVTSVLHLKEVTNRSKRMRHSQTIGGNLLQRFDEADVSNVFSSLIVCEN